MRRHSSALDDDVCYRMGSKDVDGFETVSMHFTGTNGRARGHTGADGGAHGLNSGLSIDGSSVPDNQMGSITEGGIDHASTHVFALKPRQYIYELSPGIRCLAVFERQESGAANRALT